MENIRLPEWLDGGCCVYLLVADGIKKGYPCGKYILMHVFHGETQDTSYRYKKYRSQRQLPQGLF